MNQYQELFQRLQDKSKELEILLNPPATTGALEELEKAVNQKLPKDISEFYGFCNGFETDDNIFRIIPIEEILQYKNELEPSSFYLAEYMIYSDFWTIQLKRLEEYIILNADHSSEEEVVLTNSIHEFLERLYNWG